MKRIFVLGSINTDLVIEAPYFPKEGETLMGSNFCALQGGKGANQAVAASRLGGEVYFCGKIGSDSFGMVSLNALKSEGINCEFVNSVEGPSGTAIIVVANQNNKIILNGGANQKFSFSDVDDFLSRAEKGDIFVSQLEINFDVVCYALKKAKEKEMLVILNPAPASKKVEKSYKFVDIFTPNETEYEILGGKENLITKSTQAIILTKGGEGYEIITSNESKKFPCMKVDVVDTTAAGDTFLGGFVAKLANGSSIEDAARFGSIAASIACTKKGAQPSIPTLEDIEKYK